MNPILTFLLAAWAWFVSAPSRLFNRLFRRQVIWLFEHVEDFPDEPATGRVYLAGDAGEFWGAAMTCPCGCGETIELNLLPQVRPRWSVPPASSGPATLMPSVWRRRGCRSHFIVRKGQIVWC